MEFDKDKFNADLAKMDQNEMAVCLGLLKKNYYNYYGGEFYETIFFRYFSFITFFCLRL